MWKVVGILSALVGILAIVGLVWAIRRLIDTSSNWMDIYL